MIERAIERQFPDLSNEPKLIERIKEVGQVRGFKKGETIIDYGDYIEAVPLVLSGLIKIIRQNEEDHEVLLYFLGEGESCAASFSCCLIRKRSEIRAVCEEDSEVLMIPLVAADEWMGSSRAWRDFVLNMYDTRLLSLIDTVDRVAFANLDQKLLHYLDEMVRLKSTKRLSVSHHQIAQDLNASRESVSRLLKKLERSGKLRLSRNEITVLQS